MGGYNSGPYSFIGKTGKATVNQSYGIDVRRFNREGMIHPGSSFTWTWTDKNGRQSSIGVNIPQENQVKLSYVVTQNGVRMPVETLIILGSSECNYGGQRHWFCCPGCSKRVAWLYLRGTDFKCRHCHRLTYYSCQESGNLNDMSIRRVNKVLTKLKSKEKCGFDIMYHIPSRPRYMHRKTYQRLLVQYARKKNEYAASVRAKLDSFGCDAREFVDLPGGY